LRKRDFGERGRGKGVGVWEEGAMGRGKWKTTMGGRARGGVTNAKLIKNIFFP
jgi:hypothetical protein